MPWMMQVRNRAGSVMAAASVLIPMQQVPACEMRVIMAAQPGSGPNRVHVRDPCPGRVTRVGNAGHVTDLCVIAGGHAKTGAQHFPLPRTGHPTAPSAAGMTLNLERGSNMRHRNSSVCGA